MPARSVTLSEHDELLIESSLRSGRFASVDEVVSEGLRLLEEHDADDEHKLAWLRGVASEAFAKLDRGEGIPCAMKP